jgi:hypothetical protein
VAIYDLRRGVNDKEWIMFLVTDGVQSPWRILQPPTGTGKTQGTCVYAAMQAGQNRETEGVLKPVGILIVTRLKEDANGIQATTNNPMKRPPTEAALSSMSFFFCECI